MTSETKPFDADDRQELSMLRAMMLGIVLLGVFLAGVAVALVAQDHKELRNLKLREQVRAELLAEERGTP